jgi:8-oxo-dGTP pyrophosphatase MutT (NUDIX family)
MITEQDIFRALQSAGGAQDRDGAVRSVLGGRRRRAAVLCPVVSRPRGLSVMLTMRSAHLKVHAGQIAFPGGKIDPTDSSPLAAALREADEEIGLPAHMVDVLGALDPYDTSTGFVVTPFVGTVDPRFVPMPDEGEVAEVFEIPFDFLMDLDNHDRIEKVHEGRTRRFYQMVYGKYRVWGATAGMLRNLAERLHCMTEDGRAREAEYG